MKRVIKGNTRSLESRSHGEELLNDLVLSREGRWWPAKH